jgi:uncharacterized protein (TIGR03118 family)
VQNINGTLYVTYAQQDADKHDDTAGAGHGFVDAFNLDGTLITRLVSGGDLNSPWGLALAPSGFGGVGGALLVGNFGDGRINAYDPTSGAPLGPLQDAKGGPLFIDGLWGLRFGNRGSGGSKDTLYFTGGPSGEEHGVFGDLIATPEPGTWLLGGIGLLALGLRRRQN